MPPIPATAHCTLDLRPTKYQSSLNAFRSMLETTAPAVPFLRVALLTPKGGTLEVQVRHSDVYVIAFLGADNWYALEGEPGAWGVPAGTGGNYNDLGKVGLVTYDDLSAISNLSQFRKGVALDKRLLAITIALTSESTRFATVATYFVGLTNSVGSQHSPYLQGGVDFEYLKRSYFNRWEKPVPELEVGQVSHFTRNEVILPRYR